MHAAIVSEVHTEATIEDKYLDDTQKLYTVLVTEQNLTGLGKRWYKTLHDNGFVVIDEKHRVQVMSWLWEANIGHFCLGRHMIIPLAHNKHRDKIMYLLEWEREVEMVRYNSLKV